MVPRPAPALSCAQTSVHDALVVEIRHGLAELREIVPYLLLLDPPVTVVALLVHVNDAMQRWEDCV